MISFIRNFLSKHEEKPHVMEEVKMCIKERKNEDLPRKDETSSENCCIAHQEAEKFAKLKAEHIMAGYANLYSPTMRGSRKLYLIVNDDFVTPTVQDPSYFPSYETVYETPEFTIMAK